MQIRTSAGMSLRLFRLPADITARRMVTTDQWFSGGFFIGAGPWYHGHEHFWGHVDNHYDRHDGWHGEYPPRGEHLDAHHSSTHVEHFNGNEMRDGHGHSNLGAAHEHGEHDHGHGDHEHH